MAKVKDAFAGKKANIGYVVAGYPSVEATKEFLLNLDGSCLDLLELGIPYSDPLADGKLIAQASFETAAKGVNTGAIFAMLEECKGKINKPVVFLVYFNIVFAYGVERFIARSKEVGIAGFIIPDLPFEESEEVAGLCAKFDLDLIPLISVTSQNRADKILKFGSGFIYALGAIGVSGSQRASEERLKALVESLKKRSDLPVAVGFGVKNKNDADEVKTYADGAIIGTEIVKLTAKFEGEELIKQINKLFLNLAAFALNLSIIKKFRLKDGAMMDVAELGIKHLCEDTLGYKVESAKGAEGEFYGSSLPIFKGKEEFHFYLYFKKDTLNRFASVLLGVDKLAEDELSDICKEVANLTIGYAKNLLNEREANAYKLGTPEYLGRTSFHVKLDDKRVYKIKNRTFQVGYKKI